MNKDIFNTHVRLAGRDEHDEILRLAKLSKYTRDYGHIMFSSPEAYMRGWILVATIDGEIVGFTCVRHKVRAPETMLYFIGIHPDHQGKGIGWFMLEEIMENGPHDIMSLNVMKDNPALKFYERHGFRIVGEAIHGKAFNMRRRFAR